jgi:hypothetical protein
MPTPETKDVTPPAAPLEPFTCPWAKDGLAKALAGLSGPSSGVEEYKIGSRSLRYRKASDQTLPIYIWDRLCQELCTDYVPLPPSITGAQFATRVVQRDV